MRIFRHDVVDSTNERAFAALDAGDARHGDVHVARAQSAGRGRLGRAWHSPPGEGLYLSAILMPPAPPPPSPALTIAAGLAVLDAVRHTARALGLGSDFAPRLKWPNDVLVGDAKLAGILVETRGLDAERPCYVVGIGLNVAQRSFPEDLSNERAVTSLALAGIETTVDRSCEVVSEALLARTASFGEDDLAALDRDYARAAQLDGGTVRIEAKGVLAGELVGLSIRGGLIVRDSKGNEHRTPLELVRAIVPVV